MSLFVLGINHKTASVDVRERVAFSADQLELAYRSLSEQAGAQEAVILSTCNRTEIYCFGEQTQAEQLTQWLASFHDLAEPDVTQQSYLYQRDDAVRHLIRVAAGLDSMVLGEPQILGQLKQAFTQAKRMGQVFSLFERLFQHTFATAKRIRSETDIGANAVSVAFAAVQLAKHIFANLSNNNVLLIGAGETIELVARHLKEQGVAKISVANRTLANAQQLAQTLQGEALTLTQVPDKITHADIVISSTASQLPILGKGVVETALKKRRHKPMLLLDLAVPRDVEPEVAELDDAYLYSVDDLQNIIDKNMASREEAARQAEALLQQQAEVFLEWQRSQSSLDTLIEYRQRAEQTKNQLLERALNQLAEGADAQLVLSELASKLTNRLIHAPTKAIKQAAATDNRPLLQQLRKTLELDE